MAGKMCNGEKNKSAVKPRNSIAYCEGRHANKAGGADVDNPHQDGSEAHEAWRVGFLSWVNPPSLGGQDCCADAFGGGFTTTVPDVVGLTEAAAISALEAVGLVAVAGTGTTDPVISQDPVAGTEVSPGSSVTYNLTA